MSDALHLVTAVPLPPQLYQLPCAGFTAVLLRTGPMSAVVVVRLALQLDPSAPLNPGQLVLPVVRDMDALFAADAAGEKLRATLVALVQERIEQERREYERQCVLPFGTKATAEA